MNQVRVQRLTDYISISLAGICALHCFLMPVALILFPVVGSMFLFEEVFHELLLLLIIPASVIAIFLGCRRHKDFKVLMLGVVGLCFLLAGAFAVTGYEELILTFVGASIMICGHLRNFRLCRRGGCGH